MDAKLSTVTGWMKEKMVEIWNKYFDGLNKNVRSKK